MAAESAYDRHLKRRREDSAYSDGFDYGHTGGTADANPWTLGDERRAAWSDGWRIGTALRSFDTIRDDIASELQRLVDAGELDI